MRWLVGLAAFALASAPAASFEEPAHHALLSRGATIPFLLLKPEGPPAGSVVLLVGGGGRLDAAAAQDNFPWRVRRRFVQAGYIVVAPGASSDHPEGWLGRSRASARHADDLGAVLDAARAVAPRKPVWIVGMSRGAISALNLARSRDSIAGVVLASPVTREGGGRRGEGTVFDIDATGLRIPLLVVLHAADACEVTAAEDLPRLLAGAGTGPIASVRITGGRAARGRACGSRSPHGFLGSEEDAVGAIVSFMART